MKAHDTQRKRLSLRARRATWLASDLCNQCGHERDGEGKVCRKCLAKQREYSRAKHGFKPWKPGGQGRPPLEKPEIND